MCGRYTLRTSPQKLLETFGAEFPHFPPRYNIAPTQLVFALRAGPENAVRQVAALRWGLVPSWAKDIKGAAKAINARAETVAEKPMFRAAFKRRRCLIPADGYYEWRTDGKQKQPFHFRFADQHPFAFAGLWEAWGGPEGTDSPLETCTIITTSSSGVAAAIHDRMPVIIPPPAYDAWLGIKPTTDHDLQALLHSPNLEELAPVPVSTLVNSVKNDVPECVEETD